MSFLVSVFSRVYFASVFLASYTTFLFLDVLFWF